MPTIVAKSTNDNEIITIFIFYLFFLLEKLLTYFATSISHLPISRFISCSTIVQRYKELLISPKAKQKNFLKFRFSGFTQQICMDVSFRY